MDFYVALAGADTSECNPDESMYAGSINLDQHRELQSILDVCEQAGVGLPYFQDSQFTPAEIELLLACLQSNRPLAGANSATVAALDCLERIVRAVAGHGAGMKTFCD